MAVRITTPASFAAGRKWSTQNTEAQIGTCRSCSVIGKALFHIFTLGKNCGGFRAFVACSKA